MTRSRQYSFRIMVEDYGNLWDKNENMNLLYTNDVLQFSNLAVQ